MLFVDKTFIQFSVTKQQNFTSFSFSFFLCYALCVFNFSAFKNLHFLESILCFGKLKIRKKQITSFFFLFFLLNFLFRVYINCYLIYFNDTLFIVFLLSQQIMCVCVSVCSLFTQICLCLKSMNCHKFAILSISSIDC